MVTKLDAKELRKGNRDTFINAVETLQESFKPVTLVVQQSLLRTLDSLFTFSQLKNATQVENVVKCDEEAVKVLQSLKDDTTLIFLIDVRTELNVSKVVLDTIIDLQVSKANVISVTYNDRDEELGLSSDYLREIFSVPLELAKWYLLPTENLDRNVLDCDLLLNSEGVNMYYPTDPYFRDTSINILLDNLSNVILSILERENITIMKSLALGDNSKRLIDIVIQRLKTRDTPEKKFIADAKFGKLKSGERNDIIVFERGIDPVTPMMADLTYSGILSELDQIYNVPIDEEIWDQLKFLNFGAVGSNLNALAKDLQSQYESRHEANTISEIKNFVDNLGDLQNRQALLKEHTVQSSDLMEYLKDTDFKDRIDFEHGIYADILDYSTILNTITEMMCFDKEEPEILRLCCLFSQIKNGLREKEFNALRQELVDSFGNEMIFKLDTLEKYGLFSKKHNDGLKNYRSISKALDTVPDVDIEPTKPRDMNYAFSGVVPLFSRLLQSMFDRSVFVKNNTSILQSFIHSREPTLDKLEPLLKELQIPLVEKNWIKTEGKTIGDVKNGSDLTFLVFIGGITHGEISTIRYLKEKLDAKNIKKEFVVITDGIITGNDIFSMQGTKSRKKGSISTEVENSLINDSQGV
ncbi:unnamed protein product [Kluyveromyces dobzhanskii CBS 2104]|uniref:WGS project CCBQ000000000 data, contig 00016 n=1 Tax=Kluyveromyces dobzhanskii CBS 2104 TaxID=1427455 RepID=A0A0A8L206_9SACH|nr:unnamed protein product [Kluyveromyces dobzhanskii CBS 2104]